MTSASDTRRRYAAACHTLADERLEQCANPVVVRRYENDRTRLAARRALAETVMEAAALLMRDAETLEKRDLELQEALRLGALCGAS